MANKIIQADILISGGGLAGMTCAIALNDAGFKVALIEQADYEKNLAPHYDGRALAISGAPWQFLEKLGVSQLCQEYANPIEQIRVVDADNFHGVCPLFTHFSASEIQHENFGFIIESRALRFALISKIRENRDIIVINSDKIRESFVDSGAVLITTNNGIKLQASLLILAEGRQSALARQLGFLYAHNDYQQVAMVSTIQANRHHGNVAVEQFMPSGPFAMLPMSDNRMNIVWTESAKNAQIYQKLNDDDYFNMLRDRFGDWLGEIKPIAGRFYYPIIINHALEYTKNRIALIADSAHAVHPVAGQGFNLGLRDIKSLSEILVAAKNNHADFGLSPVLSQYNNAVLHNNQNMIMATDALVRLFSNANPVIKSARRLGLWGFNQWHDAKKFMMRTASS